MVADKNKEVNFFTLKKMGSFSGEATILFSFLPTISLGVNA